MANAIEKSAIFECPIGITSSQAPPVRAVYDVNNVSARDRTEHSSFKNRCRRVFTGAQLQKVDLKPGSAVEPYFEHDRLTNQGIERVRTDVAHASGSSICVSIQRIGREEAVVVTTGLQESGLVNLPASIAIGAVIEEDLVGLFIVVKAVPVSGEFRKSGGYLVVGITVQIGILYIDTFLAPPSFLVLIPPSSLCPFDLTS